MALTAAQKNERAISQIQDRILEITLEPQPSYSLPSGLTYSWSEYLGQLNDTLDKLIERRGKLAGPFMVRSYGR